MVNRYLNQPLKRLARAATLLAALATLTAHSAQAGSTTLSNAPDPIPHIESINLGGINLNGRKETVTPMQLHVYLPYKAKIDAANGAAHVASGKVPSKQRGPFPVLLYAHGRPAYASERAKFKRPIHARHVQYWLFRGYAVVAPIRPGYGASQAKDQEASGVGYSATGQCLRPPSLEQPTQNAAAAQRAALDWVRQQPWAQANHIVLEGQSAGGLATVALCATNPPGVRGCINFSGGAGGDPQHAPGQSCAPEHTAQLMRQYGSTTRSPSLWLYAPNDMFWGPTAPKQWFEAFNRAAAEPPLSTPAAFYQSPPIGSDGHSLQRAGAKHWAPPLNAWLKQHGL
jgi:dienelactone hydrolase